MSYREWLKMQAKNAQFATDKKQMLPIQQLGQMLRSNNIMPANHQQSDYKPSLVLNSNPVSTDISHIFPSSTKKQGILSPSIDIAILENTPSFYKMTNNLQNTSNNLTQGGYNEGDDDAGVFEDLDILADPH